MFEALDPVLLARIQFGFTVSFHFIFPAFSFGTASYLMVLEGLWLKTGSGVYANLYRYWLKIFAVAFGTAIDNHNRHGCMTPTIERMNAAGVARQVVGELVAQRVGIRSHNGRCDCDGTRALSTPDSCSAPTAASSRPSNSRSTSALSSPRKRG